MITEYTTYGDVFENCSLKDYNTYHIDSSCDYLIKPKSVECLIALLKKLKEINKPYFIIGAGSNIIIPSSHFNGVVIKLDNLHNIEVNKNIVISEAGASLNKLAMEIIAHGLKGLEWATGIPGNVGGSVVGNAGAYNSSIFDYITEITCLDKEYNIVKLKKDEIKYSYRYTSFKDSKDYIIISVTFSFALGDEEDSLALIKDRLERRSASQPLNYPSAGSVFRNPEGLYAGKLIEDLNLKNYHINDAFVSDKHANFIINKGNATSYDIINLINEIKEKVKKEYNVDLFLEQEIIKW